MRENLLDCAGKEFTATINGISVRGLIQVENDHVYLCQDYKDGNTPKNKLGYKYSWHVQTGSFDNLASNEVYNLIIIENPVKSTLTKIPGKWAILCDGSDDFIQVLEAYCLAFHPECRYDFDYEDTYYGFNGSEMDYEMPKPERGKVREFTLKEFKQAINYNLKIKSNEKSSVKVQRETPDVTEGERFTGISVSGRTGKIAVSIGHLSYKTVSNECF